MGRSQFFTVALLSVSLIAVPAMAKSAPAPVADDPRATDAFQLFRSFCFDTSGNRDKALAVLGAGNAMVNRLPNELMQSIQKQAGGVGWAIRSPANAQLLLAYNARGMCEVRIAEADELSVVGQFSSLANLIVPSNNPRGTLSKPEKRVEDGATRTFRTFSFVRDGRKVLVALSTSDKRVGEQQHLITFGFVS
jgi:hypothetical protein